MLQFLHSPVVTPFHPPYKQNIMLHSVIMGVDPRENPKDNNFQLLHCMQCVHEENSFHILVLVLPDLQEFNNQHSTMSYILYAAQT